MRRFGRTRAALDKLSPTLFSTSRDVVPTGAAMPFGAKRVLDVSVGRKPWTHSLDTHTFTIAAAGGGIQGLTITCDKATERLEFQPASEWTVPDDYGSCRLQVDATRGTYFTLYELP
jgi:hypothetical protein